MANPLKLKQSTNPDAGAGEYKLYKFTIFTNVNKRIGGYKWFLYKRGVYVSQGKTDSIELALKRIWISIQKTERSKGSNNFRINRLI